MSSSDATIVFYVEREGKKDVFALVSKNKKQIDSILNILKNNVFDEEYLALIVPQPLTVSSPSKYKNQYKLSVLIPQIFSEKYRGDITPILRSKVYLVIISNKQYFEGESK